MIRSRLRLPSSMSVFHSCAGRFAQLHPTQETMSLGTVVAIRDLEIKTHVGVGRTTTYKLAIPLICAHEGQYLLIEDLDPQAKAIGYEWSEQAKVSHFASDSLEREIAAGYAADMQTALEELLGGYCVARLIGIA